MLSFSEPSLLVMFVAGALAGVALAHGMFGKAVFSASRHARHGSPQLLSELVATFGLLAVIFGTARRRASAVPFAVAAYITAAYWFTASTSFANPAVTLARSLSDTFAGIRPADVPGFVAAQLLGAAAATVLFRWLIPALPAATGATRTPWCAAMSASASRGSTCVCLTGRPHPWPACCTRPTRLCRR